MSFHDRHDHEEKISIESRADTNPVESRVGLIPMSLRVLARTTQNIEID